MACLGVYFAEQMSVRRAVTLSDLESESLLM